MGKSTTVSNGYLFSSWRVPFILMILLTGAMKVSAQEVIWNGNVDENWHNPSNWQPNRVPSGNDLAVVRPSGGNPFPVISEGDVTISDVTISRSNDGGALTVSNNRILTITNSTKIHSDGSLYIRSGGQVQLTGGTFEMAYNNSLIDLDSGSFISDIDIEILGNGFNAGSGSVIFNENLTVANNKAFNVEAATVAVHGNMAVNGIFNGDDGTTTFNSSASVNSGGVLNLDSGELFFNEDTFIGNSGIINLGNGDLKVQGSVAVESSGYFNIEDATVSITGDADFTSGGFLSIQSGSINVEGNASLSSGGEFNLEAGSLNVGEDATFEGGGVVNAGQAQLDFKGDLTVPWGGTFNADSSTVSFTGDHTQTINTAGDDINFYNVHIASGSFLQTDGSTENTVIIENNLSVEEGGSVEVKDDDTIDIQGNLDDQGEVESIQPFVYGISTPSLNEVVVIFDKEMDPASAEEIRNYSIDQGITISSAVLDPSDAARVILQVSTLVDNREYELTINNVFSAEGGEISSDHIKRFTTLVDVTYYSRTTGRWNNPSSWSIESHTGPAASGIPNAQDNEDVIIGSNHTITVGSFQDISNLNELVVDHTGSLVVGPNGTLGMNTFTVTGAGTFELQEGGTLAIGSAEGIVKEGSGRGNIQTRFRHFSSTANYIYNGMEGQVTGSGLPEQMHDLYIQNESDVTAVNNVRVEGVLYLDRGSLIIPSGQGLIARNRSVDDGSLTFQRVLDGEPGWRMISSPVEANYSHFLNGVLKQGFGGSDYENLQPNIMFYDETYEGSENQRWRTPSSATDRIPAGLGYNLYLFGDVSEDERYNDPLPDTLSVEGLEHSGPEQQINLNVSYTAEADTGWNLVGNPYGASIDWDDSGSWIKKHIDETIYIWDPDSRHYKTWNGITGSLSSGLIPPFQAFWIKAHDENPELRVSEDAKTFGGDFVGKTVANESPEIKLELRHQEQTSSIFFSFSEDAKVGKDRRDGYYLQPPPDTQKYIELYSIGRRKNRYSINTLPLEFGTPIEIPIGASVIENYQKISESVTLNISDMQNIPYSWELSLIDRKTGKELTPSKDLQYVFSTDNSGPAIGSDTTEVLKKEYHILTEANPDEARFALHIDPGALGLGLPDEIELKQNYPNPAVSQTAIRFALPIQNEVTLEVFDILGRKVADLALNESYQAGLHTLTWDTSNLASGTYLYRLVTDETSITKKLTILK